MPTRTSLAAVLIGAAIVEGGCTTSASSDFVDIEPGAVPDQDAATGRNTDAGGSGATDSLRGDASSNGQLVRDAAGGPAHDAAAGMSSSDAEARADAAGADAAGAGETGRVLGMTAAHNAVRQGVKTQLALPDLIWSPTLAAYAQEWATSLASSLATCLQPVHRSTAELEAKGYGENLAAFAGGGFGGGTTTGVSTAQQAVDGWAAESSCWTYGNFMTTDRCDMTCTTNLHSDGCGHYTQIVWRETMELGCGVATCMNGRATEDIWICNYAPAGNFIGQPPY